MRGRQIGKWIDQRDSALPQREERWSSEEAPSRRKQFWRIARWGLLLALVLAVGWWVRREGGYRRFIASLREGKVVSVEYQPYPNSAFIKLSEEKHISAVADWLKDARPLDSRYGAIAPADCEVRITMADGNVKRIWIGPTGPQRSGGTLVGTNTYLRMRGDGWERVGFSGGLSALYTRLPVAQQLPFSAIPLVATPAMVSGMVQPPPSDVGEVDISLAQGLMERGELGAARRMLARALALNARDPVAQQLMLDAQARIRFHLPQVINELERDLPQNPPKLDRQKYLQLRERLMEAALMAEMGDEKIAELRKRLNTVRPELRIEDFKEVVRLAGTASDRYAIRDFAWSPDGTTIAACGTDGRVRVWETLHGQMLENFPAAVGDKIYFSDDGSKVWVWNDQGRTWWDVNTGKPAEEGKVAGEPPLPPYRFQVVDSDTLTLYLTKEPKVTRVLAAHAGTLKLAKASPDGDQLATFAQDKVLCIWGDGVPRGLDQLSPYERLRRVKDLSGPAVFLDDGSILVFGKAPKEAKATSDPFKLSYIDLPGKARHVQKAARRQQFLVTMADGKLVVVQPDEKKVFRITKPDGACGRAGISPDGKTVAIGNLDGSVRLIDVQSGASAEHFRCMPVRNRNWAAAEFSSDGGWVLASGVGFVSVWNTKSREQIYYSEKAAVEGASAAFTPDGKQMAIIYKDSGVRALKSNLRDAEATGTDQLALCEPTFSKDGRWIACIIKSGEVNLCDSSANFVNQIPIKAFREGLQFSDDGSVLLIKADDNSIRLMEVPTGRELRRLKLNDQPDWLQMPASFSRDGKQLIAGPAIWSAP